ncbi:hypothetical protein HJFPF1_11527 [Paramyrothecium foliicola]|nr:hypothetical protein HJFPF1_11527 [Paramyrothecium foliicola]
MQVALITVLLTVYAACFPFAIFRRMKFPELGKAEAAEDLPRQDMDPGLDENSLEGYSCNGVSDPNYELS